MDIGCGSGEITLDIAMQGPNLKVYAIDYSFNMLKLASTHLSSVIVKRFLARHCEPLTRSVKGEAISATGSEQAPQSLKIDFIQADGKKMPFKDGSFDMVLCANMLHHIKNPLDLLNEINRVAKNSGVIVLKDLIRPRFKFVVSLLVGIFGLPLSKILRKEYRDSHYAAFTIEEFKAILKQSSNKIAKIFKNFPYNVNIIYYPRRAL